jgi:hypothetical protein
MPQLLSGQQISDLQEALLAAFPTRDDLRIMVRTVPQVLFGDGAY